MKTKMLFYLFFLLSTILFSTIINIPADQPTIQAGIDVAVDADTVLVQPGTYVENINYIGKNITVASLFLTTQDTTYISQTIIDGNLIYGYSVVKFINGEDSTAVLTGFTITNGYHGIHCGNNSSPSLINVKVLENIMGGIRCVNSSPSLINVKVLENINGGGFYCDNSSPYLENVTINGNTGTYSPMGFNSGGGITCFTSTLSLVNVTIIGNSAKLTGGGIYCYESSLSLENVTISGNIANNHGGGIYCRDNSNLSFDPENRCNIFLNFSGSGCDLYADNCNTIDVIVDTFTVLQPDDYFAYPIDNFAFDILNAKVEQVNQDLYVSPDGSNNNSGLTVNDPLLTISYALAKILPDSTNILTIHLSNGTYSPSGTGERFPLNCRSYVSLLGEDKIFTILDPDSTSRVMDFYSETNAIISNITITNGYSGFQNGGGINCVLSNLSLLNVAIIGNFTEWTMSGGVGGGIYCYVSNLSLINVTIIDNSSGIGGGIACGGSSLSLVNVTITGNSAEVGGGISCGGSSPSLVNVTITGNSALHGGGINCGDSNPSLINVTITDNSAYNGGLIYCYGSHLSLMNCILGDETPEEVYFSENGDPNSLTISYSDITAGIAVNNNGTVNWLEGNIYEFPLFVGTGDHPFMLQDLSPCVNAGIPDTTGLNLPEFDLAGNPRVYGGRIDMGAYENQNVIVNTDENLIPLVTKLNQNYPNPFNPTTTINYSLKENSKVSLNIYNIKGQKVKQLVSDQLLAGQHSVIWDGKDDNNKYVSSGIYFYKLKTDNFEKTKKMILLK